MPLAGREYWMQKFRRTIARDDANQGALMRKGWTVIVVWECQLRGDDWLLTVRQTLDATRRRAPQEL
jgi:DNA mismatch endonuclease (patch repair protein)